MLSFTVGDTTTQSLLLTLDENQTLTEPLYLFTFTHVLTKTAVQFTVSTSDEKSFWPERYNEFQIKPGELFLEPGEWHYKVTEQQTGVILEQGIMIMNKANPFTYTKYNASANTRFKAYRG